MTPNTFEEVRVPVAGGVSLAVRLPSPNPATGTPALLVHGLASNARLWDGVATRLAAAGHPAAAVDLRGHGRSDKPDDGYDWPTLIQDLLAVADALGWSRPVVAGQSFGGNLVVELAARHSGRVAAAVLVDGGTIELADRFADWPTCEAALAPPVLDGTTSEQFERFLRVRHPDWPEEGIAGTLANVEVRADGTIRARLSRPHHLALLRLLWEHRPSLRWSAISVPVVLVPAEDPNAPDGRFMAAKREEVDRAARALAHGRAHWIVGDHDLHAQHPDQLAALIAGAAP